MDALTLAADEHGLATTAALHDVGLDSRDIAALVDVSLITPLARGWYATCSPTTPEERHILTTRAMLKAHGPGVVGAHHSGLLLENLPVYGTDLRTVRLSRTTPGSTRTRPGLSIGRAVPPSAWHGLTVVPAMGAVQHGLSSGAVSCLVAADAALHRGMIRAEDLEVAAQWVSHHPNAAGVKAALRYADGRHASPGETRLAHAFRLMGIGAQPQYEVSGPGFLAFVDFKIDGEMVVVEFDGKVKYGRSQDQPDPFGNRRTPADVVWAEKQREDRIRELGYEVVRVTWKELNDPATLARRIHAAVRRSRQRHSRS